jgi:hypothetical protein
LPWNSGDTKALLASFLKKEKVIFETSFQVASVPLGKASARGSTKPGRPLTFVLPDYLDGCAQLASSLKRLWAKTYQGAVDVRCSDIARFTQEEVLGRKTWEGFLSPLSPGAPYAGAIYDQYFSGVSPDSWFDKAGDNHASFYLLGMGKTEVAGRKGIVCGLRPSFLGLSDMLIDDLDVCEGYGSD